jgi:hypothetical protein
LKASILPYSSSVLSDEGLITDVLIVILKAYSKTFDITFSMVVLPEQIGPTKARALVVSKYYIA